MISGSLPKKTASSLISRVFNCTPSHILYPQSLTSCSTIDTSTDAGVSRTLNCTYLRPVPMGETVIIESEVVHAGKRLCAIKGVMKRERDGAVLTTCEHGKASIDPEVVGKL